MWNRHFTLTHDLRERLLAERERTGANLSEIVRRSLEQYLGQQEALAKGCAVKIRILAPGESNVKGKISPPRSR